MDQLVALQAIYESFSRGTDALQKIDSKSIEGCCPELVAGLLDGMKKGRVDEETCRQLSNKLDNVYEVKRAGDIILRAGHTRLAAETYSRALSLCSDEVLLPVLQNNLGRAHAASGDLEKAVYYYEKAAGCFSREGDKAGLAHVLGNLGSAFRRSGDRDRAIEHYYKSLKTFEDISDAQGAAQMTGSLGRIYADMGERDLAARYFERSLNDFEAMGDQKSSAWILDRMGRLAAGAGEWDTAICRYHQSLSLFEQQGQIINQAIVLSNLGRAFLELHEPDAAREPLERAVRLVPRHTSPGYQNALFALAYAYCTLAEKSLDLAHDLEKQDLDHQNPEEMDVDELARLDDEEHAGGKMAAGAARPAEKARQKSSRLFALAADRYQELAASLPGSAEGRSQVRAAASLARGRSYLSLLGGSTCGEKAISIAERALSALDGAAAHCSEEEQEGIQALQRAVSAIKEAHSSSLLKSDSARSAKALSSAAGLLLECLPGGGETEGQEESGAVDDIANGSIIQPLKSIKALAQCCAAGAESSQWQQPLARELKSAAERLSERSASAAPARISSALFLAARALEEAYDCNAVLEPAREALLLIAGSIAGRSLAAIQGPVSPPAWDDSMRLVAAPERAGQPDTADGEDRRRGRSEAEGRNRAEVQPMTDCRNRSEETNCRKLVLSDGSVQERGAFLSEDSDPDEGWLVPMRLDVACRECSRPFRPKDEDGLSKEAEADRTCTPGGDFEPVPAPAGDGEQDDSAPLQAGNPEEPSHAGEALSSPDGRDLPDACLIQDGSGGDAVGGTGRADAPLLQPNSQEGLHSVFEPAPPILQSEKEPLLGPFSLGQGIAALKGLTALVAMLLAVEAVLHLI